MEFVLLVSVYAHAFDSWKICSEVKRNIKCKITDLVHTICSVPLYIALIKPFNGKCYLKYFSILLLLGYSPDLTKFLYGKYQLIL